MLTRLVVKDLAVVSDVTVTFASGLNVISGETGAGKSLLMGALGLAVGDRATSSVVRTGARSARVEAHFEPGEPTRIDAELADLGLEPLDDGWLVLRREVASDGKSRAFVGETQVRVSTLKTIGALLVDRHGQGDQSRLTSAAWQRDCLDALAGATKERASLAELAETDAALSADIEAVRERHASVARERDFFEHQVREIDAAGLEPGEEDELREEQRRMSRSGQLLDEGRAAIADLDDGEAGAVAALDRAARALEALVDIDADFRSSAALVESARLEAREAADDIRQRVESFEFSAERRDDVERRLDTINALKRKYGRSIDEILGHANEIRGALDDGANAEHEIADTLARREKVRAKMTSVARTLTQRRTRASKSLVRAVHTSLAELGMEAAVFEVVLEPLAPGRDEAGDRPPVDASGAEAVRFLLAANPGQALQPLGDAASGGETSRVMLALRVLLSEAANADVQILDEVDAGIGGKTARAVGSHVRRLAERRQVIAITHLASVACHADHHFRLEKTVSRGRTKIGVDALSMRARVSEIARMLSGGDDDATARRHARELLKQVQGA